MQFGYSRFIVHPMWEPLEESDVPEDYRAWAGGVARSVREHPDRAVRGWSAYLAVLAGDSRGWEQYLEALPHAATIVWCADAIERFGESMTSAQRAELVSSLQANVPRSSRARVAKEAALAALKA